MVASFGGPYTASAPAVIEACIAAQTAYVDLSGELPLLRRVDERFDGDARRAGTQIVQMAGWEALPADVLTLLAARRAVARDGGPASGLGGGDDGPGACAPIVDVQITVRFSRQPPGGVPLRQSVSSGTLASILEQLDDPDGSIVGDPAGLLPASGSRAATRAATPIPAPRIREGRVLGPTKALAKRGLIGIARMPRPVRQVIASRLRPVVAGLEAGPSGRYLDDWAWTVRADATATSGHRASASLDGEGHPGYTATAAMAMRLALHLARADPEQVRCGPSLRHLPLAPRVPRRSTAKDSGFADRRRRSCRST